MTVSLSADVYLSVDGGDFFFRGISATAGYSRAVDNAYEVRFARNRAQGRDQKMSIFGPATRTWTHACKAGTIKTDKRALHMHVRHVCVVAQI